MIIRLKNGDIITITISDMAKYPFLPQVREYIAERDLDYKALIEVPGVKERAKTRIRASFDQNFLTLKAKEKADHIEVEMLSFVLAILYVSLAGDNRLLERFSLFEAQHINVYLKQESREDLIVEVARALKWKVNYRKSGEVLVPLIRYLKSTAKGRLLHDSKWKLVNRAVDKGWVYTTPYELARLIQEDVKERIEELASREPIAVPKELQEEAELIKKEFNEKMPNIDTSEKIRAQESDYPPCVTYLIKRASKGEHLSHTERFTMVTYLLHQGISVDSIISLFSKVSDFDERKTRYQVENLAGMTGGRTEYTTYNCGTLQTHGVCKKPEDPICRKIRNPLTYHLMKQKVNS